MITLAQMRERVMTALAEESTVFWTLSARDLAINDAQRIVASITKGVRVEFPVQDHAQVAFNTRGMAAIRNSFATTQEPGAGGTRLLPAIAVEEAAIMNPRAMVGNNLPPRWVVVDDKLGVATLVPTPSDPTGLEWEYVAFVIPEDVDENNNPVLYMGNPSMDKYLSATTLLACGYLLLRERYDGDAERFYNLALQELMMLGVDPSEVPPLQGGVGPKGVSADN